MLTVRSAVVADRGQQDLLLDLLNSTPVSGGVVADSLANPGEARSWQRAHGGSGSAEERRCLVRARDALQQVVRGSRPATALAPLLEGVAARPAVTGEGLSWELDVPSGDRLAVEAVLAWNTLRQSMPGRLRPCANPECRLFLIDRSKPNKARWCSMAVCGNRMKARRHYQRARDAAAG
ncbi:CGNR zinc finger domain-containing protein [Streptomyces sp. NRRL F-5126]|uniref:CGNR zinc finger domain-containing protein n=1 Tax=Streptomyces sp. NRRL F-5126 TaxID=1463857 RepID=UPI00068E8F63|nr:CGNR zinc finger domain-containing protein [Streptomyces sp. NRRL F-5126]